MIPKCQTGPVRKGHAVLLPSGYRDGAAGGLEFIERDDRDRKAADESGKRFERRRRARWSF